MSEELDLQLLSTLLELIRERSATRTAARLGITQSAVSQRLRRLRQQLDDPLLVPGPDGLVPTDRALRMVPQLEAGMAVLREAIAREARFEPSEAQREFVLATSDYGELVALPPLLERLGKRAPGVSVRVVPSASDTPQSLARGEIDLVVGGQLPTAPDLIRRRIGQEGFVVMMRQGHPASRRRFDLPAYLSLQHLLVAPRSSPGGVVDVALSVLGEQRRIALTVPHFVVAAMVLAHTDLILTGPAGLPAALRPHLPLTTRPPPLALPTTSLDVLWHARSHADPAHRWFRDLILG